MAMDRIMKALNCICAKVSLGPQIWWIEATREQPHCETGSSRLPAGPVHVIKVIGIGAPTDKTHRGIWRTALALLIDGFPGRSRQQIAESFQRLAPFLFVLDVP